jgi:hypothetical protein
MEFNPAVVGSTRFSPLLNTAGTVIPTLYAGATLDCAMMETVFHDVPFAPGTKNWSKATHLADKVYSQLVLSRDFALIDLSAISLRKLGISRVVRIESDASKYPETQAWAFALHKRHPLAEGLTWTSRQADPARALVLFEDHLAGPAMTVTHGPVSLLHANGSTIAEVVNLAQRLGVFLTP